MLPAAAVPKSQGYFNILILKSKPFYLIFKVLMVKIKSASDIEKNGAIIFKSTNHFLRLFFEQIMAGAELDDIISMFGGVKLLSGELVDPITYQIETTKEQKL